MFASVNHYVRRWLPSSCPLIRVAEPHDHCDLDALVIFAKRRSPSVTLHRRVLSEGWM